MPIPLGVLAVAGAGGGAGSTFDFLETVSVNSATLQVSFTNLGAYSNYKHLQFRAVVRDTDSAQTPRTAQMYLNGGGSTRHHYLRGDGSSTTSGNNTTYIQDFQVGANNTANIFTAAVIDILDFSNTSKKKTVRIFDGYSAQFSPRIHLRSFFRDSTDAITSVTFEAHTNWAVNSRFSLYGIR